MTATDARSHCDCSTIASVVRNGAPAGDIARWNPTCRADWRERHLGDIYAGSVGREARSDVQIRCSIDGTRYLLLSHVLRHSDTRTGDRTSGHVGSRPLSVCNTSAEDFIFIECKDETRKNRPPLAIKDIPRAHELHARPRAARALPALAPCRHAAARAERPLAAPRRTGHHVPW